MLASVNFIIFLYRLKTPHKALSAHSRNRLQNYSQTHHKKLNSLFLIFMHLIPNKNSFPFKFNARTLTNITRNEKFISRGMGEELILALIFTFKNIGITLNFYVSIISFRKGLGQK